MNILVTGGAGYIGASLVALLLEQGHRVRVLDSLLHGGEGLLGVWSHPAFRFVYGDIRDGECVQQSLHQIDAVVHLAAIVGDPACARQPAIATAINLDASMQLLEASAAAGVKRFVFASTCSNYGKMSDPSQYVDETSPLRPVSLYAETKVAVEQALLEGQYPDLCATSLRFATVYGVAPRMRFDLTVNEFTLELLTRKHLVIFGEQFWRPYVHVRDIARAIVLTLNAPPERVQQEVFNVGTTNQNYRKQELAEMIQAQVPEATIEYVHKQEDPRDYRVSFAKIATQLDFTPTRSVAEGIAEVAQLVRNYMLADPFAERYRN